MDVWEGGNGGKGSRSDILHKELSLQTDMSVHDFIKPVNYSYDSDETWSGYHAYHKEGS